MTRTELKIGELARAAGTSPSTIRYYEQIGLLPAPARLGGQRRYRHEAIGQLAFIRHCREFGFPVEQVRTLVSLRLDTDRSCDEARELAEIHLASVRDKLAELHALERNIAELLEEADGTCAGASGADCPVLRGLAEPACEDHA
ncbi:MerR family transcriptional regulator [Mycolicibacterium elephantis]|uniref:MerR family transcriptional regulator n=1 Tax=Mycolicibacterium elephantis TaxID=81858 RepID=UPI0007EA0AE0|nr:MerR family transcriptional regulator [Mycolicibacterium elephantis]OBB28338.1 MerR family transcriptional regulator [Mycolicibacterium elephantis]OBE96609.1 MerR family transcriptional regulator [Mycolicibacterium elephantis]